MNLFPQPVEPHGTGLKDVRERFGSRSGAVCDDEVGCADRSHMARHLLTGFARSDHEYPGLGQMQTLLEPLNGHGGNRKTRRPDAGLHPGVASGLHCGVEDGPEPGACAVAGLEGGSNLAQDFGLAKHHRFEAASHAEEMAESPLALEPPG